MWKKIPEILHQQISETIATSLRARASLFVYTAYASGLLWGHRRQAAQRGSLEMKLMAKGSTGRIFK